jgi:hypothetical protein
MGHHALKIFLSRRARLAVAANNEILEKAKSNQWQLDRP